MKIKTHLIQKYELSLSGFDLHSDDNASGGLVEGTDFYRLNRSDITLKYRAESSGLALIPAILKGWK